MLSKILSYMKLFYYVQYCTFVFFVANFDRKKAEYLSEILGKLAKVNVIKIKLYFTFF